MVLLCLIVNEIARHRIDVCLEAVLTRSINERLPTPSRPHRDTFMLNGFVVSGSMMLCVEGIDHGRFYWWCDLWLLEEFIKLCIVWKRVRGRLITLASLGHGPQLIPCGNAKYLGTD